MKIPRFRISLRVFLIATTISACLIGLFIRRHVAERSAERTLIENGLSVVCALPGETEQYSYACLGGGSSWSYGSEQERKELVKTVSGRLKWQYFRHAKYIKAPRSAPLSGKSSNISDASLAPLADLRHVERLVLAFQPITDEGLGHLRNLRSLRYLNLAGTKFTDIGLSKLTGHSNIEDLVMEGTDVSDVGLQYVGQLRQLREVAMSGTKITGAGLKHLGELTHLESLGLSGNPIRSDDLRYLTRLKKLKVLYLSDTELDDSAAKHFAQLPDLNTLGLDGTKVGDKFIAGISSLRALRSLDVSRTQVTNASEMAVRALSRLEFFHAADTAMDDDTARRIDAFTDANEAMN